MSLTSTDLKPVRIFKPVDEWINLALPIIFVALAVLEIVFSQTFLSSGFMFESFIVDILFLNITHNAFTYAMILGLPELGPWVKNQGGGSSKKFWLKLAALNVVLCIGFFLIFFLGWKETYLRMFFFLITIVFPIHHALSQSFGLSLVYNKKISEDVKAIENKERVISKIFLLFILIGVLFVTLLIGKVITTQDPLVKILWIVARAGAFFLAFTLILNMFFYPEKLRALKATFSLRYIVWAFSIFSPIAVAGTKIIHGVEYAFVTRKMISNSRAQHFTWLKIGLILSSIVIVLAYFRFRVLISYQSADALPIWLYILASASFALTYSHYYLDRNLFQMRYKINRESAGQLLVKD